MIVAHHKVRDGSDYGLIIGWGTREEMAEGLEEYTSGPVVVGAEVESVQASVVLVKDMFG